ncbi:gamma-glutamyl-gamma-aminobutyrate hydrolase family protein [Endozoicomonas sp. G2_2]|uniref:gamma-glutamyl-gamma-aminobutyrate hydrolase family protein n=1 Tax=Endozoicomonas sp. G2_2 TaxID=2821092 RepID=UPI001ADD22E9|nr:gamma-glutamyl-gamma-aminobutyrate hydrolase family protein [Endozoicomonas sp. G2_2]MBO9469882.1 gamma-glutamyl-gamma-aminobutyrate hydrolase family protein [Endozoicomonas sp. G2_2]
MARKRPLIAVTGKASRWAPGWWAAWLAIALAGGRAVRATPRHPMPAPIDGLVIGGGDDIATDLYGATAAYDNTADRARDEMELAAIKRARVDNTPILGICRGAQLINVAAGGTLYSDISELRRSTSNRVNPLACKPIALKRRSRLAAIVGSSRLRVNSLHHQAVHGLGSGIQASARDADGFVQAIEARNAAFVIGVQWHPEYLCYRPAQYRLFRALVAACHQARPAR